MAASQRPYAPLTMLLYARRTACVVLALLDLDTGEVFQDYVYAKV
jgi:hypothetical protein